MLAEDLTSKKEIILLHNWERAKVKERERERARERERERGREREREKGRGERGGKRGKRRESGWDQNF